MAGGSSAKRSSSLSCCEARKNAEAKLCLQWLSSRALRLGASVRAWVAPEVLEAALAEVVALPWCPMALAFSASFVLGCNVVVRPGAGPGVVVMSALYLAHGLLQWHGNVEHMLQ